MIYEIFHGNDHLLRVKRKPRNWHRSSLFFIARDIIEEVLNLVNCKVLQYAQSATTDTYVLSESSMFIFRTHFVLKTCGETTLLHAVQPVLALASEYCGFDAVDVRDDWQWTLNSPTMDFLLSSKSSIAVANSFDRNCKRHRIQVSNTKYVDDARVAMNNASFDRLGGISRFALSR